MHSNDSISDCELTILMPCLNEAATVARCVAKARGFLQRLGVSGEVLVADNGSFDGSQQLAEDAGARVVPVSTRGYGAALIGGISQARGRFIVMGDADDSYAFDQLDGFLDRLRAGFDLVMGNRFAGGIEPGAMPVLHRWVGNPVLSALGRLFFRTGVRDFHCGLRGFNRDSIMRLDLRCQGMEFASEMVLRASLLGLRVCEVPTTLRPDGRGRPPHLNTWRDGWRHLKLLLLYSPSWLFLGPGALLLVGGNVMQLALLPGPVVMGGIGLDIHTMLFAAGGSILGLQLVLFAGLARVFGIQQGLLPRSASTATFVEVMEVDAGLLVGGLMVIGGVVLTFLSVASWNASGFGALDPGRGMRAAIPAVTLLVAGAQVMVGSMFVGLLGLATRDSASLRDHQAEPSTPALQKA
jgi:hypothetical protein